MTAENFGDPFDQAILNAENNSVLQDAMDKMAQGIAVWDADLNLLLYSQKFLEIWDLDEDHVRKNRNLPVLLRIILLKVGIAEDQVDDAVKVRLQSLQEDDADLSSIIQLPDGRWLENMARRAASGRWVMTYTDITARRSAEEKEHAALAELELLNQQKDRFFSIIAHDLRSPFNALIGLSDHLFNKAETLSPEQVKEFSGYVHRSAEQVFKLLENLLDWARLQMERVEHNPVRFNVREIVRRTVDVLGPVAEGKHIQLIDDTTDLHTFADPDMIDTVIRNLVNNAIKFTPEQGTITLRAAEVDSQIKISVADTGIGINEDRIADMFSLAQTSSSTSGTAGEGGTGLGLILCKELVERNSGEIRISSQPGVGTDISILLPITQEQAG
jgi:signal transduction histidine kinase